MGNLEGLLIEYFESEGLQYGYVLKHSNNQVHIINLKGRQQKFTVNRIVVTHSKIPETQLKDISEQFESSISKLQEEIDVELLWEMVKDNTETLSLFELSDIYFDNPSSKQQSALIRAIRTEALCFKLKGLLFTPRTKEQIEELRLQREIEAQKSEYIASLKLLYSKVNRSDEFTPSTEEIEVLKSIYSYHFDSIEYKYSDELKLLNKTKAENEIIVELLKGTGFIPNDTDKFVALAGLKYDFTDEQVQEAENLEPYSHDSSRIVIDHEYCFSIDDPGTTEIDDAISVDIDGNLVSLGIHIADVQSFVKKDSVLDRVARERCSSLYMETGSIPMFPEKLSSLHTSLIDNEPRPVMTYLIKYDLEKEEIVSKDVLRGEVVVKSKLSYDYSDELLEKCEDGLSNALRSVESVCKRLRRQRFENGAIEILRPEIQLRVEGDEILINNINRWSRSRRLIGELMIFINNLAGQFCRDNNIPTVFRVQEEPEQPVPELGDNVSYDPVLTDKLIRFIRPSKMSTTASGHSGLGIDAYSQLSCPIRRYADLVVQRQVSAFVAGSELPYTLEEIYGVIADVEDVTRQHRTMYQDSANYWYLRYLQKHCLDHIFDATAVYRNRNRVTFELDLFGKRATVNTMDTEYALGDKAQLRIEKIDPEKGILKFKID